MSIQTKTSPGFTLIEILVVMLIISIVITTAMLSVQRLLQDREAANAAKELATIIPAAQQQAILQPTIIGLKISNHGYAFYRFVMNNRNNTGIWQLIAHDHILRNKSFSASIQFDLSVAGQNVLSSDNQTPQIIFYSSGDITPFHLTIKKNKSSAGFTLTNKGDSVLLLQRMEP